MPQGPLRILLTDPHSDGGGQVRYIQSLVGELVRFGHHVTIGCRPASVLLPIARESGCHVSSTFYFARGLRPGKWCRDVRVMRAYLKEARPDIVHVNGSQDHWIAALARAAVVPRPCLIRTRHNTYPVKDGIANRILNRRMTTHQITVCEMVRQRLMAQRAFDASRLTTIHNGVDAGVYRPDPAARASARAEFGYGDQEIVCGIVARLVDAKGHRFLFQAVAGLRDVLPDLRVLVLGQGRLESALRLLVRDLDLEGRVQFAGFRADMEHCLHAFDIGVQPSIDCDTSSFSLKEQMAAGIPVIASDFGGLPEIVSDGVEGRLVPTGTVEPLAEAIHQLASDGPLRRAMGGRGRARVLRDFSLSSFAQRTVEVYRGALGARAEQAVDVSHEHTSS